jgi:hypothetical protein
MASLCKLKFQEEIPIECFEEILKFFQLQGKITNLKKTLTINKVYTTLLCGYNNVQINFLELNGIEYMTITFNNKPLLIYFDGSILHIKIGSIKKVSFNEVVKVVEFEKDT